MIRLLERAGSWWQRHTMAESPLGWTLTFVSSGQRVRCFPLAFFVVEADMRHGICPLLLPAGTSKKGKPPSNVYSNFKQYKLSDPVGLLRADTHRPPFRADLSEVQL